MSHGTLTASLKGAAAIVWLALATGCGDSFVGDIAVPKNPQVPGTGGGGFDGEVIDDGAVDGCDVGRTYVGFGGMKLGGDRQPAVEGMDRLRVKPYAALSAEYARALGSTPSLMSSQGATFGRAPARWHLEPLASAVSIYTAYRVAFQGCLGYTASRTTYAPAPTAAGADRECAAFARKFWSRTAMPDELAACAKVALVDTQAETDPKRRWAYTCAAVLTAAGFLTW